MRLLTPGTPCSCRSAAVTLSLTSLVCRGCKLTRLYRFSDLWGMVAGSLLAVGQPCGFTYSMTTSSPAVLPVHAAHMQFYVCMRHAQLMMITDAAEDAS